ncbi:paraquat-inducible protein A [Vibrio ponticus]|uniref:paraquat-inducible protein A n=1 Tax=Vibrio ponticus TaxID=265668 RepID=UPI0021A6A68F|nr:paraquat-inducible protein A [Vibrio ponticus]
MRSSHVPDNFSQPAQLIACEECGLVSQIPDLEEGQIATCPRCSHTLSSVSLAPCQTLIAYSTACLMMLAISLLFPFMSFSVKGITQEIFLINTVAMLDAFEQSALALLLLLTVLALPALYLVIVTYLYMRIWQKNHQGKAIKPSSRLIWLCKSIFKFEPWLMADVFLIGVLVSLIKISSMADIGLGYSFWAFCAYTVLVVKAISLVDRFWVWNQLIPNKSVEGVVSGQDHLSVNHVDCHQCHQINLVSDANCHRCGSKLHPYDLQASLQKSWAFLLAAVIFYFPANLYPIMYTTSLGSETPSTIMGGVVLLWQLGSYPIALVIFIASVFIPMAKMLALAWIYWNAKRPKPYLYARAIKRQKLYRVTEFIGRWSMIDIFVVAILVALVQLHNLMAITPGPASLSFAAVVILTMLSAISFDSRSIWSNGTAFKECNTHE